MPSCSSCQAEVPAGTAFCPNCGAAMAGATPGAGSGATPQLKFDLSALSQTDRIVGVATFVLFVSFFMTWFSVNIGIGTIGGSGLDAHGYLYIPLLISIAVIVLLGVSALGIWSLPASSPVSRDQVLLIATGINFVLVLIGFLAKPGGIGGGVGWAYGAFIGLIASIVALAPLARPLIDARRKR
jgi:hypothetical protein